MNNKTFRVLSIDFDYFQNASEEALMEYPDGIDLQPSLSQQVWKGKYDFKPSADLIKTVTCKTNEMYFVENVFMNNCKQDIPVLACFSHEYIYGFIQEQFSTSEAEKLEIVNVDFHADYYNDNVKYNTQDCGNWCYFIKQEIPGTKITWIAPENHVELYEEDSYIGIDKITTDLSILKQYNYDAVFLCRSDNWLPLHLDKHFQQFLHFFCGYFSQGKIQQIITEPRDYPKELIFGIKDERDLEKDPELEAALEKLKSFN